MSRRVSAIEAIRRAIDVATSGAVPFAKIGQDDDLIDDLALDPLELESLGLILEEIFAGISLDPERLWAGPIYRSPESLADWCTRKADEAAWAESQRQRKRA